MRNLISLLTLLLLASTAGAAEDYWVWVDKSGVTNYSEQPPTNVTGARHITSEQQLGVRERQFGDRDPSLIQDETPAQPTPAPGRNPSGKTGPVNPDSTIADQRAAVQAKIAETKQRNCEIGKRNLAQLEAYSRIRVKGDDGKERVLSDQEHQAQIEQARQIIQDNCSG